MYIYTPYTLLTPVHPDISSSAKNLGSMPNLWQDPTPSAMEARAATMIEFVQLVES